MYHDLTLYLRIAQALLAFIALCLNASLISFFSTHTDLPPTPSAFIFLVFTSTFTLLLSLPYAIFAPTYFRQVFTPHSSLAVEFLTKIFWFAGFVSGAVWLSHLSACIGAVCQCARAGVVFAALEWVLWCITLSFPARLVLEARRGDPQAVEERDTGVRPGYRGMTMAEKVKGWKLRTEATDRTDPHGEDGGGLKGKLRRGLDTAKVRAGNVAGGWREKTHGDVNFV